MTYRVQDRLRHLATRRKAFDFELVTLTRGAQSTEDVAASLVLMQAEEMISVGLTRVEFQDFYIDAADYLIGGVAVLPQQGDSITRPNGDVFKAVSFGGDEPPYLFTTSTRDRLHIHAERVSIGS